jgi:hypothetical protein
MLQAMGNAPMSAAGIEWRAVSQPMASVYGTAVVLGSALRPVSGVLRTYGGPST